MKIYLNSNLQKLFFISLALPAVVHSESVSSWRVSGDIEGYSQNAVQICLIKSGANERSAWETLAVESAGNDCQELVVFDRQSNLIHLAFPGAINAPTYFCSSKVQIAGRHPCNSVFFVGNAADPSRRTLDRALLKKVLIDAGGMAMANQKIVAAREAELADCQKRLDGSASIQSVQEVMTSCETILGDAGKTQASEKIDQIKSERKAAELATYRNEFEAAIRSADSNRLNAFIDRYAANDPDRLVPKARATLDQRRKQEAVAAAEALRKQAAEAEMRAAREAEEKKIRAAEEAEAKRRRTLAQIENQIANCKSAKASAAEMKAREQAISSDSGYTNPGTLRNAAAIEYDCNTSIRNNFRRYQELGGTKTLSQIN